MAITDRKAQIYLPEEQYRGVKAAAKNKRSSFSQVVREAVAVYLAKDASRWANDPISKHIGMFRSKEGDLAENHDRYIYDD
jgi:hypothetical protein